MRCDRILDGGLEDGLVIDQGVEEGKFEARVYSRGDGGSGVELFEEGAEIVQCSGSSGEGVLMEAGEDVGVGFACMMA